MRPAMEAINELEMILALVHLLLSILSMNYAEYNI